MKNSNNNKQKHQNYLNKINCSKINMMKKLKVKVKSKFRNIYDNWMKKIKS